MEICLNTHKKNSPCTARKESAGKNIGFEGGGGEENEYFFWKIYIFLGFWAVMSQN